MLLLFATIIYPQNGRPENLFKNCDGKIIPAGKENIGSRNLFDNAVKENNFDQSNLKMNKKSNNNVAVIDSVIVKDTSGPKAKYTYTYEANGNVTLELYQEWTDGQWVNIWQDTYTYDINGNLTSKINTGWSDGQWTNNSRYTYTYDANGNNTSISFEGALDDEWFRFYRILYSYDASGNIISETWQDWSDEQWVNKSRCTYTLNGFGKKTLEVEEKWSEDQWVNSWRNTYIYDVYGVISDIDEYWGYSEGWVNNTNSSYTYDSNGNMTSQLYQYWSLSDEKWKGDWRYTYTYDTNGNMTSLYFEDCSNEQWVSSWQYTYTYNSNGKMTTRVQAQSSGDQWVNRYKSTFEYDGEGRVVYANNEIWEAGNWIPLNSSLYIAGVSYGTGSEIDFYYNVNAVDVASNSEMVNDFSLSQNYPNPFNPSTIIRFSLPAGRQELPMNSFVTLKVYNLLGQEVATLVNEQKPAGNYEVKFDASNLASGVYVYRLNAGDFTASQKMLLLK